MTDTGQVPGEGLPENAGTVEQPGVPAPGAYTYLDPAEATTEDDEMLLMPGSQGAWGEPHAAPMPAPHEPGPHETAGRDSGQVDLNGVRVPGTSPAPHPGPARRPLHMGPAVPDGTGSPVRSLADRGPHTPPVRQAGPPTTGPEYLDIPRDETGAPAPQLGDVPPQAGAPWGAPQPFEAPATSDAAAETVLPEATPVTPAAPTQQTVGEAAAFAQVPVEGQVPQQVSPQAPQSAAQQVPQQGQGPQQVQAAHAAQVPQPVPGAEAVAAQEFAVPEEIPAFAGALDGGLFTDAQAAGAAAGYPVDYSSAPNGVQFAPVALAPEGAQFAAQAAYAGPQQVGGHPGEMPVDPHSGQFAVAPEAVPGQHFPQAPEGQAPQGHVDQQAQPLGQFVPVEGTVPTTPHLAPTPPQPMVVPPMPEAESPEVVAQVAPVPVAVDEAADAEQVPQVPQAQAAPEASAEQIPQVQEAHEVHVASETAETPEASAVNGEASVVSEAQVVNEAQAVPAAPVAEEVPVTNEAPETAQVAEVAETNEVPAAPADPAVLPEAAADTQDQAQPQAPAEHEAGPQAEPAAETPQAPEGPEAPQAPETSETPQAPEAAEAAESPEATEAPEPLDASQVPEVSDTSDTAEPQPAPAPEAEPQAAPVAADAPAAPEATPDAAQAPEAPAPVVAEGEPEILVPAPRESAAAEQTADQAVATDPAQGPAQDPTQGPAHVPAQDTPGDQPEAHAPADDAECPAAAPGYDDAEREAVLRVMRERRDIRNGFRNDPIPHEVLLRVLEAAHTAPSVGHSQPWDFVVIRSADTRRTMHELAERQRDAYAKSLPKGRAKQFKELKIEAILDTPVNIVVTADPTRGGRHTLGRHTQPQMAPYSSALAVENLWLAARAEGLGVGWVSFFDEREMVRALGLPEHLEVVAYLCVGYVDEFPDEPELMQAGWSKRRPLSWVVHEETYGRRALPGEDPHDLLAETVSNIRPLDAKALGEAWERQKRMTKPAGALGMLEIISAQLSGLSRMCPPPIPEPAAVAIFAGDHGVHAQGVTPWPQEVTAQMVANFLGGGAVCNAFANQVGAEVCVIDVGVAGELPATPGLLPRKVRAGTADMTTGPALSREDVKAAIEVGIETARDLVAAGNKALLTGEMGIANTTASAALISVYTGADPSEVTGRGTGINDETHARKVEVVRRALDLHRPDPADPVGVLAAVGGLEHAALVGLLLGGASLRTPVILDGVSAGAAALVARAIAPEVLAACIAGHRSAEPGHVAALNKLGLRPLVDLDLRLGEGTGALLALPIVQSAARAMHEVATFDSAGVTEK
ncbi:nicotinate-nucleotide--dimethylbenzimidazole phosphoribosyltransferase [Streptomyces sp. NPDC046821]|uniref:nicotinate-nucleotide--dimethylbenzimidazole phosphoribosyltransferase n=1 Tax=Streptomyces sp. NPDC046821 TaxID=3154702 RepID=UPI0033F78CE6